jgi:LmbE family N-acetylglucosaminyl deacetylase
MMISNKDKILIIAAHPDDQILGCGVCSKYSNIASSLFNQS